LGDKLKTLNLDFRINSEIKTIFSPINNLSNLSTLNVFSNSNMRDFIDSIFQVSKNLVDINLRSFSKNYLNNLNADNLPMIKSLYLSSIDVGNNDISNFKRLTELNLNDSEIHFITDLPNLTTLY